MCVFRKCLCKCFINILLSCLFVLITIGGQCRKPYTRNPNLKFLVGDTINQSLHCFNPLVSVDGQRVYYLTTSIDSFYETGSLYSINTDGNNNMHLFQGYFDLAALSSVNTVALHPCEDNTGLSPESLLLLLNPSSMTVDTLPIVVARVSNMEFNSDGNHIYYSIVEYSPSSGRTRIYRLAIADSSNVLLLDYGWPLGFDVNSRDSLCLDSIMSLPQINPAEEEWVIGTPGYENSHFLIRNTELNMLDTLPDSLIPYSDGTVGYAYWFPDGQNIAFMAKPYSDPAGTDPGAIWILENIFVQIDE